MLDEGLHAPHGPIAMIEQALPPRDVAQHYSERQAAEEQRDPSKQVDSNTDVYYLQGDTEGEGAG